MSQKKKHGVKVCICIDFNNIIYYIIKIILLKYYYIIIYYISQTYYVCEITLSMLYNFAIL